MNTDYQMMPQFQAASIMEALMAGEGHPSYAEAKRAAEEVIESARQERVEHGRQMMQAQIDDMDADEFASFQASID